MNIFELKSKLKKAFPNLKSTIANEIVGSINFCNRDVQTMINDSVASVKNKYSVREIDIYAEELTMYTHEFLSKLDKMRIHWLISHVPIGLNFYSEMDHVISEPYIVKSGRVSYFINKIPTFRNQTFILHRVVRTEGMYIMRGIFVNKSILSKVLC